MSMMASSSSFPYGTEPQHGYHNQSMEGVGGMIGVGQPINYGFAGMGGTLPTVNDNDTHFGTGISTSNFASVNVRVKMRFTDRAPPKGAHREMLVWIAHTGTTKNLHLSVDNEVFSIHSLNTYMASLEGRKKYGVLISAEEVMKDFAFAGSMNTEIPLWVAEKQKDQDVSIIVGRRARCSAVTRSCTSRTARTADGTMMNVFIVVTRRKFLPEDLLASSSSSSSSSSSYSSSSSSSSTPSIQREVSEQYLHFWDFSVYQQEMASKPPPWFYCDDESTGDCFKLGFVTHFSPNNKIDPQERDEIRKALSGKHNNLVRNEYEELMERKPYVDIYLQ